MINLQKLQKAINFSIKVHEEPVKQVRKGKNVPYVTHPLAVGLILSQAGAKEDVVIAGILHDTIEDCEPYGSVTKKLLTDKFGENVANLVDSVTEKDKSLSWEERKEKALEEIRHFSKDSLLLKSADVISNNTELIDDYERDGAETFARFNAPKEQTIPHTLKVIAVIVSAWEESPLVSELTSIASKLLMMLGVEFTMNHSAIRMSTKDFSYDMEVTCPVCAWRGTPEGSMNTFDSLMDMDCPICDKKILIVEFPLA